MDQCSHPSPRLNQAELNFFKQILLEKRKKIIKTHEYYKSIVAETPAEAAGEISLSSYHIADQASDAMEREKIYLFIQRGVEYIKKIDQAIERIENGTYGICRVTGELIDPERLKAVPTTTISCQAKIISQATPKNKKSKK